MNSPFATPRLSSYLLAAALLVSALLIGGRVSSAPPPETSVRVYFAPSGKDRVIHHAIEAELEKAGRTIDLAIYQFSSPTLAKELAGRRKDARIRILFDEEQAKFDWKAAPDRYLADFPEIQIRYVKLPGRGASSPKFHHKFCVVDRETVLTGSYNWTVLGDEENHENFLVIRDAALAEAYTAQFEKIWNDANLAAEKKGKK